MMLQTLDQSLKEVVEALGEALETRDAYTSDHGLRVAQYACELAKHMGLPRKDYDLLRLGARLHDLGKIGISDAILLKPGPLTEKECAVMQFHTRIGRRIVSRVRGLECLLPIVELHHENFDGSGYPYGLRGDQTPLAVRIVRVADAFDAMTTNRVYRPALSRAKAIHQIQQGAGTQFDRDVVAAIEVILDARHFEVVPTTADDLAGQLENLVSATS